MKFVFTFLSFCFICFVAAAQTPIPIDEAKIKAVGDIVTVEGIVTNGPELGAIRYMQDGSAGIAVFDYDFADAVKPGDLVQVTGALDLYNELMEIKKSGATMQYKIISSNNPLPAPKEVTTAIGFTEDYEGELVRFSNIKFTDVGNFKTASTNYKIFDGSLTYEVRVVDATNIVNTPIPTEYINLVGIMSQFKTTYQLLPRSLSDFEYLGNPPVISSSLTQSNITTTSFDVSFTTLFDGNTTIKYGKTKSLEMGALNDGNYTTNHITNLSGLSPATVYYVQAISESASGDESKSAIMPMMTASLSSGDIKVYFNSPVNNSVSNGPTAIYVKNAIADTLANYFSRAKYTIDMSLYTFDNATGILDALKAAANKGIKCRFVADSDIDKAIYNLFPGSKITRDSEVQGIMHNKFVIIDAESPDPNDPIVWTGSTNFSDDQLNKDPNNVIIIQDQSLARAFTMEFDEMFGEKFGSDKLDNTPKEFVVGGKRVEAYFSPGDDIRTNFKKSVAQANYELFFAIMQLTRTDMANAIEDRIYDKVFLAGILDDTSTPENQACFDILAPKMKENLKVDGKSYIFHHKYFIADPNYWDSDPTVWTGSYNWTNSAQVRNDENVVVVHDKNVANIYYQEFVQRFNDLGGILATDDINKNWQLMAWPNPVSNELTIAIFGKNPEKINLQFTDSSGKVLLQKNWTIGTAPSTFKINTANYAAGLYLLTINVQTQKIIIQK